ncbi:L,D-transpeptidase [Sphingosinicella sp. BN140058]|nr:L,D-transpeptidase [Sphingosinicella sp. BN140058]
MTSFLAAAPAPAPGERHDSRRAVAVHAAPAAKPSATPPAGLQLRARRPDPAAPPEPVALAPPAAPIFAVRSILALDHPLAAGDYAWSDEGVPEGPLTIVADLAAEKLYVYRGGIEIGRTSMISGWGDKPTPLGVFPILEKDRDHVSNIYDAPMPFMLRLTWDGISIHGSVVSDDYATHGCLGIPDEFAATLFAQAKRGDYVLVTRGWKANGAGRA